MIQRFTIPFVLLIAAALGGCAATRATRGDATGIDRTEVIKAATFDHDCPVEKIRLVSAEEHALSDTEDFVVDVCGTPRHYKRIGTMYFDDESRFASQ